MPDWYYRYTDDQNEWDDLGDDREIEANTNASPTKTTYVTLREDDESKVKNKLGMSSEPDYRIGPVPDSHLPPFHSGPHAIQPSNGNGGGNGLEVTVTDPVYVFGPYNLDTDTWEGL